MLPGPPLSTLFPYTTLFRSVSAMAHRGARRGGRGPRQLVCPAPRGRQTRGAARARVGLGDRALSRRGAGADPDRKSTRLNSSHTVISYAVFFLKKKIIPSAA